MNESISSAVVQRYFEFLETGCAKYDDWHWFDEALARHPELASMRMPNEELPLRVLLKRDAPPGFFLELIQLGAEQDIITAAAAKETTTIKHLLNSDPQLVHVTDEEGNTPLHWACGVRRHARQPCDVTSVVNLLLATGADVNAKNSLGLTPLHRDSLDGTGQAWETLIEHGAEPNILFAVFAADHELLDELLSEAPDQIHWRDPYVGWTLLHYAAGWECDSTFFNNLLERGARRELEACSGRRGMTPLLYAIDVESYEAAEILIRLGADVNARETTRKSGQRHETVLFKAVWKDRTGLAEMLIARGAEIHERGPQAETLLFYAKSLEMAELLLNAGIQATAQADNGETGLDCAIEEAHRDIVTTLIQHGVEPTFFAYVILGDCKKVRQMLDDDPTLVANFKESKKLASISIPAKDGFELPYGSLGGTALHYAAKTGSLAMLKLLLERGADVNATTDSQKWTPLHDATYFTIMRDLRDGADIIRALVLAGADLNAITWGDLSALDIADYLSFEDTASDVFDLLLTFGRKFNSGPTV